MCGWFVYANPDKINKRFDASGKVNFDKSYNITPGMITPVITRQSPNRVVMMKWGLIPFWAKDPKIGYKMINARSEGIEGKPSFRKPIRTARCLIPSDGFYEWQKLNLEGREEKWPWYIGLKGKPTFSFAGVYDIWKDAEGKPIRSYAIITTDANGKLKKIHHRMPVILDPKDEATWLDPESSLEVILKLLKPYPASKMVSYPVSKRVNNPREDDAGLVIKTKLSQ